MLSIFNRGDGVTEVMVEYVIISSISNIEIISGKTSIYS